MQFKKNKSMLLSFIIAVGVLLLAMILLALKIIFTKKGKFPPLHISENSAIRKKGIGCAQSQDRIEQNKAV